VAVRFVCLGSVRKQSFWKLVSRLLLPGLARRKPCRYSLVLLVACVAWRLVLGLVSWLVESSYLALGSLFDLLKKVVKLFVYVVHEF